jgi:hypothetical protein
VLSAKLQSHVSAERTRAKSHIDTESKGHWTRYRVCTSTFNNVTSWECLGRGKVLELGLIATEAFWIVHARHDRLDLTLLVFHEFHFDDSITRLPTIEGVSRPVIVDTFFEKIVFFPILLSTFYSWQTPFL